MEEKLKNYCIQASLTRRSPTRCPGWRRGIRYRQTKKPAAHAQQAFLLAANSLCPRRPRTGKQFGSERLAKPSNALFNFGNIRSGKTKPEGSHVWIARIKRCPRHKYHTLLNRLLGKLASVLRLAARPREPGPEEQAALRLRELDRVAQLTLERGVQGN